MHRTVIFPAMAIILAAGCASPLRPAKLVTTDVSGAVASDKLITIQGVVQVPATLLSEGGGGLIGKVRIYRLAQSNALRPLPGANVHLADVRGEALPDLPQVVTNAEGRFVLPGIPAGLTYTVVAHAPTTSGERATLLGLVSTGAQEVSVGLGTTMVTTALLDAASGLGSLDQGALQALAEKVEADLPASAVPDLARDESVAASVKVMLDSTPQLRTEVEAMKQRLTEDGLTPEQQRERVRNALPNATQAG